MIDRFMIWQNVPEGDYVRYVQSKLPNRPEDLRLRTRFNFSMWQHVRHAQVPRYEYPGPGLGLYVGPLPRQVDRQDPALHWHGQDR